MPRTPAKPLYRRIVADALAISWHHKHLWVLGFFATLIGFGGVSEALFNAYDFAANGVPAALAAGRLGTLIPGVAALRTVAAFTPFPLLSLTVMLTFGILMAGAFAWITVASVGGLVASIRKISRGGEPRLGEGMQAGFDVFWPLLKVNLAGHVVAWAALAVAGGNLLAHLRGSNAVAGVFFVGSFVLGVIIAFFAAMTAVFASIRVVAKNEPATKALRNGFAAVSTHWFVCVEVSLLLLVLGTGFAVALAAVLLVCAVPIIFLVALASALGVQSAEVGAMLLTGILLIGAVVAYGSFVTTLQAAAWTLLWEELDDKPLPKLLRWIGFTRARR